MGALRLEDRLATRAAWQVERERAPSRVGADGSARSDGGSWSWRDAALAVVLGLVAWNLRRHALPEDGLWHDDAWVAVGAVRGSLGELFVVGNHHPGFTALLELWVPFAGDSFARLTQPVLVAGVLGPPALFLTQRSIGLARAVSLVPAAVLVGAVTHVQYSGRVKPYVVDVLVVLALTLLTVRVARRRWSATTAGLWCATAVAVSTLSAFALIVCAVSGLVLAVHSRADDRIVRWVAIGLQLLVQVGYAWRVRGAYDIGTLVEGLRRTHDPFPEVTADPLASGGELLEHLGRVGNTLLDGPALVGLLGALAALAALVWHATREGSVAARQMLAVLGVALLLGAAGWVPFGIDVGVGVPFARGTRATLWLVPAVALGLGLLLDLARRRLPGRRLRGAYDLALYAAVVVVLVTALAAPAVRYPTRGAATVTEMLDARRGPDDVVLLLPSARYPVALETEADVAIEATPDDIIGFRATLTEGRVHDVGFDPRAYGGLLEDADDGTRVWLVDAAPFRRVDRARLVTALDPLGLRLVDAEHVDSARLLLFVVDDARRPAPAGPRAGGAPGTRGAASGGLSPGA